jgi:thymidylate kinase
VRAAYLERSRAEPQRMRVIDAAAPVPEIRKALERALSDL